MYQRLGQWCYRNWLAVLGLWLVAIVAVAGASGAVGAQFSSSFEIPESESRDGFEVLDEYFGGTGNGQPGSIVFRTERGVEDPEVVAMMTELFDFTSGLDEGLLLVSPYAPGPQQQISAAGPEAGQIAYADITIPLDIDQVEAGEYGEEIEEKADELLATYGLEDDVQIEIGGSYLAGFEPPETELIGLGFAIVILIVAFGSVLAMGVPIGVAVAGVGVGLSIVTLLTNTILIPDFAVQIGAMIGLGVGIDYALFIVTRYRDTVAAGYSRYEAIGIALDTAGRAVIFAGLTVVVSLLGMLLIGLEFITGLGVGAASTVTVTMIASVTLVPALLGLVKDRVEVTRIRGIAAAAAVALALVGLGLSEGALASGAAVVALVIIGVGLLIQLVQHLAKRELPVAGLLLKQLPPRKERPIRETLAYRWSRLIQGHPWAALAVGAGILLVLAAPLLSLRLGFSDEGNYPEETTTRQAYDLIAEGFGPGFNGPLLITATFDDPSAAAQAQALQAAVAGTEGVAFASPPIPNDPAAPEAVLIQVIPTTAPQDVETQDLVNELRDVVVPANAEGLDVDVTGAVPANIDFTGYLGARILVFFGVVLAVSFLLLMAVFRSLVVPLKAVVMNVLSIASAYGVVVAIFQWGWFGDVFGITGAPIEPFIPMMLFAIVFGLSMDYEVFLLSRVKEEFERTGDPQTSVADGLASTARVITAAAAIMIVVFGAFMLEDDRIVKLFGLGLAMAVFLDASLVRMLLVPATMELLGSRNWWLPRWLDRIVPNLNIEGSEPPPPANPPMADGDGSAGDPDPVTDGNGNGNGSDPVDEPEREPALN
ncbi:MAG: MMPL family transporter [Actinomycetota bacterium]